MTRKNKLLIWILVLAVAVCLLILAVHFLNGGDDSAGQSIKLSVIDSADVKSIKWTYNSNTLEIDKNSSNEWTLKDDADFPLDQSKAANMLSAMTNLYARKKITDNPSDLSKYGLDNPKMTITLKTADGSTDFKLGNENEASGYYYLMKSGDTTLYYVDSQLYTQFAVAKNELVKFDSIPEIETSDVSKIEITSGKNTYEINYDKENDKYTLTYGGKTSLADSDVIQNAISGFVNISWNECVKYSAAKSDLASFGLDDSAYKFKISYTYTKAEEESTEEGETESSAKEKTVSGESTLLIGLQVPVNEESTTGGDGESGTEYYAMIEGGSNVYTIGSSTAKLFLIDYPQGLYSKEVASFDSSDAASLNVKYNGKTYFFTPDYEKKEDEDSGDTYSLVWKYNGKEVNLSSFVSGISTLSADKILSSKVDKPGNEAMTVEITMNDGTKDTIYFYKYKDGYLCGENGNYDKFITSDSFSSLTNLLENAVTVEESTT